MLLSKSGGGLSVLRRCSSLGMMECVIGEGKEEKETKSVWSDCLDKKKVWGVKEERKARKGENVLYRRRGQGTERRFESSSRAVTPSCSQRDGPRDRGVCNGQQTTGNKLSAGEMQRAMSEPNESPLNKVVLLWFIGKWRR